MSLITSELSHFGISFTRTTVEANCTDQLRSTPSGGYFVAVSINEKQKSAEAECETFAEQNETAEHLVALNATLRRLSAALWMAMDWRAFTNRPMVIEKVNPIIGRTKEKYSAFFPESSLVVVGTIRAQHTSTLNRWALFFRGRRRSVAPSMWSITNTDDREWLNTLGPQKKKKISLLWGFCSPSGAA